MRLAAAALVAILIYGDRVHDDRPGLRALFCGADVRWSDGVPARNADGSIDLRARTLFVMSDGPMFNGPDREIIYLPARLANFHLDVQGHDVYSAPCEPTIS